MEISSQFVENLWGQELRFLDGLSVRYSATPKTLWQWQMTVPLLERWTRFSAANEKFAQFASKGASKEQDLKVLDLGCGFGMYWPILVHLGFRKFVGVDLFDMRILKQLGGTSPWRRTLSLLAEGRPKQAVISLVSHSAKSEDYYSAANQFVGHFCDKVTYQLIQADVRKLDVNMMEFSQFDLLCAYAVDNTKLGSTGIPRELFNQMVNKFGNDECFAVYVE